MTRNSPSSLLAALVLGDRPHVRRAADQAAAGLLWSALVSLARAWRLSAALHETILREALTVPSDARAILDDHVRAGATRSARVVQSALLAIDVLVAASVRPLAFKGVALIAGLYGDAGRRKVADVDLLIPEAQLRQAFDALRAAGLTPVFPLSLEDSREYLGVRSLADNHSIAFRDANGLEVDLHWRLGDGPDAAAHTSELLARGIEASLAGRRIWIPAPADAILLTTHHIVRSDLDLTSLVKDLHDLVVWCEQTPLAWSAADVADGARRWSLDAAACACWGVLARFNASPAIAAALEACRARVSADTMRSALAIDGLLAYRLEQGHANADLVALYQRGAVGRLVSTRLFHRRQRQHVHAPAEAGRWTPRWKRRRHPLRRIWDVARDAVRQRAFERTGYRALAAARQRAIGG